MNTRSWLLGTLLLLALAGCGSPEPEPATPAAQPDVPATASPPDSTDSSPSAPPSQAPPAPEASEAVPTREATQPETGAAGTADPEAAPSKQSAPSAASPRPEAQSADAPSRAAATAPVGAGSAMSPTPGVVTRETELKAEPALAARTLRSLAANTPVTITTRQGGWLQVTSGEARGWVRLLHVSSQPSARTSNAREELEAATRVATGRAGSGNIAVTTGIRGLDEEELRQAQADTAELERLKSLGVEPADAQSHAKRRGLERRQVPYPPAPKSR